MSEAARAAYPDFDWQTYDRVSDANSQHMRSVLGANRKYRRLGSVPPPLPPPLTDDEHNMLRQGRKIIEIVAKQLKNQHFDWQAYREAERRLAQDQYNDEGTKLEDQMTVETGKELITHTTTDVAPYTQELSLVRSMFGSDNRITPALMELSAKIAADLGLTFALGHLYIGFLKKRVKGNWEDVPTIMMGYQGMLAIARRNGVFTIRSRPMTEEEKQADGAPADAIAAWATEIYDNENMMIPISLVKSGIPDINFKDFCITAYGYVRADDNIPNGWQVGDLARKRALKKALRLTGLLAMPIQFASKEIDTDDGGWTVGNEADAPKQIEKPAPQPPKSAEDEALEGEIMAMAEDAEKGAQAMQDAAPPATPSGESMAQKKDAPADVLDWATLETAFAAIGKDHGGASVEKVTELFCAELELDLDILKEGIKKDKLSAVKQKVIDRLKFDALKDAPEEAPKGNPFRTEPDTAA